MRILVIIPALNEEASVAQVIANVKRDIPQADVLVVNDGSTDDTATNARSAGARVASHPFNMGVGAALRTGFRYAERKGYSHVIQIDADGQHDPREAAKLLELAKTHQVVIGSRFAEGNKDFEVTALRRAAMNWLAFWLSKICKTPLTDVTSGFRVATRPAIELFADDYPPEYLGDTVESLVIARRAGLSIAEVQVQMHQRQHGKPSQGTIKSLWYVARATLVLILAMLHRQDDIHHFTPQELQDKED